MEINYIKMAKIGVVLKFSFAVPETKRWQNNNGK